MMTRRVYDQAKIDGAQTHQVRRNPEIAHSHNGEEHRERDGAAYDQTGSQLQEEEKENQDYQQSAFDQVRRGGVNGLIDERTAIVERVDLDSRRQGPSN